MTTTPATHAILREALAIAHVKYTREIQSIQDRMGAYPTPGELGRLEEMLAYFTQKLRENDAVRDEFSHG